MQHVECLALNQVIKAPQISTNHVTFFKTQLIHLEFPPKNPDRECPDLPQPELGSVNITGREFGGKAIYSCPIGHNVIGVIFH